MDDEGMGPARREPLFNAPLASLLLIAAILLSYPFQDRWASGALSPAALDQGRFGVLFTMMFLHAGWAHVAMNALGALAFGPPVARLMGRGLWGAVGFFSFYLVCGVLSALGYVALHLHDPQPVVGASGAVSGLMGGAARLFAPAGRVGPIFSRSVLSLGVSWIIINALMAVFGAAPFMPGARIAWEAHIAGFVAGVLLIGLWGRVWARPISQI